MSPPSEEVQQPPEVSKISSGLAGVFKNLGAGRLNRNTAPTPYQSAKDLLGRSLGGNPPLSNSHERWLEKLQPNQLIQDRVAAAEALRHVIETFPLRVVMDIWSSGKDLATDGDTYGTDARKAGFDLLIACIMHSHASDLQKREFFTTITSASCNTNDFHLQLFALVELTKSGKEISSFADLIVPLLTQWLRTCFEASRLARYATKKERRENPNAVLGEEIDLQKLFDFVNKVMRFNFKYFSEDDIVALLNEVLEICRQTSAEINMSDSITLVDVLVTYGYIPKTSLPDCVQVLCGVYGHRRLESLWESTWNTFTNLFRSHMAQATINTLMDSCRGLDGNEEANRNYVVGAINVLDKLVASPSAEGLPGVPFSFFMDALSVPLSRNDTRIDAAIVTSIEHYLSNQQLLTSVVLEDWSIMLEIIVECALRVQKSEASSSSSSLGSLTAAKSSAFKTTTIQILFQILQELEILCEKPDFLQREECMAFFMRICYVLPESTAEALISYYANEHLCYPSHSDWLVNAARLRDVFLADRIRGSAIRLHVLTALTDVYATIKEILEDDVVASFVLSILEIVDEEEDSLILEAIVSFAVDVADEAEPILFSNIVARLRPNPKISRITSLSSNSSSNIDQSALPNAASPPVITDPPMAKEAIFTKGLVRIFMRSMNVSADKAGRVFDELVNIAQSEHGVPSARIAAMKLLIRIRSDTSHCILLTSAPECEGLAAAIFRTAESLAAKIAIDDEARNRLNRTDELPSARSSRSISMIHPPMSLTRSNTRSSNVISQLKNSKPLWLYPEDGPLPEEIPSMASPFLSSKACEPVSELTDRPGQNRITLKINEWLEKVIATLQRSDEDWEVYSYLIVHIGSQLSNHSLFVDAIPQIRMLRNVLCDQAKSKNFLEPPLHSGLKKADIAVCILQTITMVMSYHEHFAKSEQDDIVRSFMTGVGSWDRTAKVGIHALTICCHELPLSITKMLNGILVKMSQIITQSHTAIHILEFLAGLSRLPELYVNWRDEEYKTIFAMCFRYLQSVRDQRDRQKMLQLATSNRVSGASGRFGVVSREVHSASESNYMPNTSDDLPQYVYALAYSVITFWFMSLKLPDRAKHVDWMTRNLITTESSGRQYIPEQSQVLLDMMQRVTWSDLDETLPNPNFASKKDGKIVKKSWLMGLSIITIETALATGLTQITKRQPSATSHYLVKVQSAPSALHQVPLTSESATDAHDTLLRIASAPNNFLVQLTSSSAPTPAASRPIPLPDDDATNRALSMFDRTPQLDGHKVGVIYMGEGQTQEQEILANVMGTEDYTAFLEGLGTLVKLRGATFNTQGLDRENDMVNLHMPGAIGLKKRHTGNDFVNIIFNSSNLPFKFDTFPSDFNYVNIVITPDSKESFVASRIRSYPERAKDFYRVQVMSRPGFPEISPAAETKIVSGKSLPAFVRILALNASAFSSVWSNREGGEHISSWRNRLRAIQQLRQRHDSSLASASPSSSHGHGNHAGSGPHHSPAAGTPTETPTINNLLNRSTLSQRERESRRTSAATFFSDAVGSRSSVLSTSTTVAESESLTQEVEKEGFVESIDFSRWAA